MTEDQAAWIGSVRACGCVVFVAVEDHHWQADVRAMKARRLTVRRVTVEEARAALGVTFARMSELGLQRGHPKRGCGWEEFQATRLEQASVLGCIGQAAPAPAAGAM